MKGSPFRTCFDCKYFRGAKVGTCDAFPKPLSQSETSVSGPAVNHDAVPVRAYRGCRASLPDSSLLSLFCTDFTLSPICTVLSLRSSMAMVV